MIITTKKVTSRTIWLIAAAVAGAAAFAFGFVFKTTDPSPPVAATKAPAGIVRPVGVVTPDAGLMKEPPPIVGESRGEMLDRLTRSGQPEDAFIAFRVLQRCHDSRANEADIAAITNPEARAILDKLPKPAEVCRDIAPGQLTQRMMLLVRAAEARVPGAYENLPKIETEFPNDPTVKDAVARIVEANIQAADPLTLIAQYQIAANCNDPPDCKSVNAERALMLWTAFRETRQSTTEDTVTAGLTTSLGPKRAQLAIEQGKALVSLARSKN